MAGTAFLFVCFCLTYWLTFVLIVLKFVVDSRTWFLFHFWNKTSLTHWQAKPGKKNYWYSPQEASSFHCSSKFKKEEAGEGGLVPQNIPLSIAVSSLPIIQIDSQQSINVTLGKADAFGLCRHTHGRMSTHRQTLLHNWKLRNTYKSKKWEISNGNLLNQSLASQAKNIDTVKRVVQDQKDAKYTFLCERVGW